MLISSCVIICIGALIMFTSIIKLKKVTVLFPLIREPARSWLKKSIIAHKALMEFFFLGYCIVIIALLERLNFISNFFVSIIFCTGAMFVYIGIMIQSKMTNEILYTINEILPICAKCKKIRVAGANPDDQSSWVPIDEYLHKKANIRFTHSICPDCGKELYGEDNI